MRQHPLNTALERDRTGAASSAATLELELDDARVFVEPLVFDVASVFLDSRSHTRVQQLLDHSNHFAVSVQYHGILWPSILASVRLFEERSATGEMLHKHAEDLRLHQMPWNVLT